MSFTNTIPTSGARTSAAGRSRWIAGSVLILLSACSVGHKYEKPDIALPAAWRDASATAAWPSDGWWHGFGSNELDGLIDQARTANDDLAAAIARVREADAQLRIAGAPLLPSVGASFQATREREQTSSGHAQTVSAFSPLLTASYEFDFWGKNRALRDAAAAAASASRYDRATVELTVMTSVAVTYFQAAELQDRLVVAQDNLTSAETTLRGLRLEQTVGTATALDVAQQETTVAAINAAIPPLRQQLRQAIDAIAILIGKPPEGVTVTPGALEKFSQPTVQPGLPSELLARRPDVAEAEAQLIAANANITAARAAFFPNIALTADGGFASNALSTLLNPASGIFAVTAAITQPIFEGGALSGQLAYSKARYVELAADYHKAVISAFSNVEDALTALQQTTEQQQRQDVAVTTARHAYEISQAQLRAGTTNILTVLNTENALFTAEDTLVQVRFSHLQALVDLFNALGGGWQQGTGA